MLAISAPPASKGEQGSVRQGLEAWIAKQIAEPAEMFVAACRALADEVDKDRDHSPLWGRYLDALRQLQEPERQAAAINDEIRGIYEQFAASGAAEEWRVRKMREAIDKGEDWHRWGRLVPVGCCQGFHNWHQWGGWDSPKTCLDCYGRLEEDGTISWPPEDWSVGEEVP